MIFNFTSIFIEFNFYILLDSLTFGNFKIFSSFSVHFSSILRLFIGSYQSFFTKNHPISGIHSPQQILWQPIHDRRRSSSGVSFISKKSCKNNPSSASPQFVRVDTFNPTATGEKSKDFSQWKFHTRLNLQNFCF